MVVLAGMHNGLRELDPQPLLRSEMYDRIADLERLRSRVDERLMAHKATLNGSTAAAPTSPTSNSSATPAKATPTAATPGDAEEDSPTG